MLNATMGSQLFRMNVESALSKIIHLLKGKVRIPGAMDVCILSVVFWKILIYLFRSTKIDKETQQHFQQNPFCELLILNSCSAFY